MQQFTYEVKNMSFWMITEYLLKFFFSHIVKFVNKRCCKTLHIKDSFIANGKNMATLL